MLSSAPTIARSPRRSNAGATSCRFGVPCCGVFAYAAGERPHRHRLHASGCCRRLDREECMTAEIYWEDFAIGKVFELGPREVTRQEVLDFARQFDPQSFHTDERAAEQSIYGGLIASGWHTCALVMRMLYDGMLSRAASLGSPGVDEVRWLEPVRPGDLLRVRLITIDTRPSRSKPDRGLVRSKWEVYNQRDQLVMTMEGINMYLRRDPPA
jgi:acyl dehydratase